MTLRSSRAPSVRASDRKSTRLNSSHVAISYAVFCLKKKRTAHLLPLHRCIPRPPARRTRPPPSSGQHHRMRIIPPPPHLMTTPPRSIACAWLVVHRSPLTPAPPSSTLFPYTTLFRSPAGSSKVHLVRPQ